MTRERPSRTLPIAMGLFLLLGAITCLSLTAEGHPEAWLGLLAVPLIPVVRQRPWLVVVLMAVAGTWWRLLFGWYHPWADPINLGQAALAEALAGLNPYGHFFPNPGAPGPSPFVYGPLEMLWSGLGVYGEILASIGLCVLLGWRRAWITLAIFASFIVTVRFAGLGWSDTTAAFWITLGLLVLRSHRGAGAAILAVAAAFKEYAAAFLPAAIGYGGWTALAAILAVSAAAWGPAMILWSPIAILRGFQLADAVHPIGADALNIPILRLLAVPIGIISLFIRSWPLVVLSGVTIYVVVLYTAHWASPAYLLGIMPILGIMAEEWLAERSPRGAAESAGAEGAPLPAN